MKKENSTLTKKIKSYSALAGSMLAMANFANAQIVYTDVDPDATGTGDGASYNLDLNNDGTTDFVITVSSNGGAGVKMVVEAKSSNAIAGTYNTAYPYIYPSALALGDLIGTARTWNTGPGQTMASTGYFQGAYGEWFGATDKYMGLRINLGGDDRYGWVRMDVSESGKTFTVKDYAYDSTATQIDAGATGNVGIHQVAGNQIKIFSADQQIHVQLKDNSSGLITVSSVTGQQIKLVEIDADLQNISMVDQPIGTYLVTVRQNGKVYTQKVVLH